MTYDELKAHADTIPSMGGRQIGKYIDDAIKNIKDGRAVVEIGTWLGAATAQIALALVKYKKSSRVYTYDRFKVKGEQPEKAIKEGWDIKDGEDVLPRVEKALSVFPCKIKCVKGNITDIKYKGEKIGLYIDDAAKQRKNFDYIIRELLPHFIPGETIIILMDYYLWKNTHEENHKYQYYFMQEHRDNFELVTDGIDSTYQEQKEEGAIFLYKGGKV